MSGTSQSESPAEWLAKLHAQLHDLYVLAEKPTLDKLVDLASLCGHDLPRATAGDIRSGKRRPAWATLEAYVQACLRSAEQLNKVIVSPLDDLNAWETMWEKTRGAGGEQAARKRLGRFINDCDPLDLGVHPAPPTFTEGTAGSVELPGYVRRPHDGELQRYVNATAQGSSRMAVLVGASSTGKTRTCWEAVQLLAERGWRLWHPFAPTQAEAVLANLERVGPKTVVWLDNAQHCFDAGQGLGERVAAALATLLADPHRAPILILATLWLEHAERYMAMPVHGHLGLTPQVQALIENRRIYVPDSFDAAATDAAQTLADAGDLQLAAALERAADGCVTQDLAGGPELVHRYHTAMPAARAVLRAAMDARRLGISLHLPHAFLRRAAEDYLTDAEFDALPEDWLKRALADLAKPVYGNLIPLRRVRSRRSRQRSGTQEPSSFAPHQRGPSYRLADYLEQHGYRERGSICPPASFWQASHDHITNPDDLVRLAQEALCRYRLSWAFHLQGKSGVCPLAGGGIQTHVMRMRESAGDFELVNVLVRKEAERGSAWALLWLAARREAAGDQKGAKVLLQKAADAGHVGALVRLLALCDECGDSGETERLTNQVINAVGCSSDRLPQMHLLTHKDFWGSKRSARLAPRVGYVWIAPHGPTGWAFDRDGTPIPIEHCATVDGIPLFVAVHSREPDTAGVVMDRLRRRGAKTWVQVFIARRTVPNHDRNVSVELEGVRQRSQTATEAKALVQRAANIGAFPDTFFSDELEFEVDEDERSWLIDRVTSWWPHGLDPDGTPSPRW